MITLMIILINLYGNPEKPFHLSLLTSGGTDIYIYIYLMDIAHVIFICMMNKPLIALIALITSITLTSLL